MDIVRTHAELATHARGVLIPTMGGLHEGHLTLVRLACTERDRRDLGHVIVSVFVNPKQFEEAIDFDRYPRDLESDASLLKAAGADVVFAPSTETVYPQDTPPPAVTIPPVADGPELEDSYRPGHLAGVCQVLRRLYELTRPAAAVFGEKDWQQLQLATAVAAEYSKDTGDPLTILPAPTVREPDGLAMSSRNRFLTTDDRPGAAAISQALQIAAGHHTAETAETAMRTHMETAGLLVEYACVRDSQTLLAAGAGRAARALIAARLGEVRLIDNAAWPPAMLQA